MLCQAYRNVLATMLQGQLQCGPTLVVLGVYDRTVLEQQACTFNCPAVQIKSLLLPP